MDDAHRTDEMEVGQLVEALEDGDVVIVSGTVRAALGHRDFRIFWSGMFASNVGTWMQTIVLGAYGLKLTDSAAYVGLLNFAVLGPLVLLAPVSGVLADIVDRRRYLVAMQTTQMVGAFCLAAYVMVDDPSRHVIFGIVFLIGVANALTGPAMSAISPSLVPPEDLPGAISLFSFQMNMSRVVGPLLGAPLYKAFGPSPVFALNGFTYLFAVAGLVIARYPRRVNAQIDERGLARLASGFRIVWRDPLLRRVLLILWTMSLLSLNFISFMSAHAENDLGIDAKSTGYGVLYALFGFGAAAGAMSVGSVFAGRDKASLVRPGLAAFAVLLGAFSLIGSPAAAYPIVLVLGYAYFVVITSLSTVLQANISHEVRGRVMSLWIMGFGGAVGIAALLWSPVADWSVRFVLIVGALWAIVLTVISNPDSLRRAPTAAPDAGVRA